MEEESDSWIEINSNPSESSSDEHIITSGLRITSQQHHHHLRRQRPRRRSTPVSQHPNLAATALIDLPSPGLDEDSDCSSPEGEDEVQDVASYIATLPLSSSGSTDSEADVADEEESGSDVDSDEGRTVFASSRPERLVKDEHDAALRASLSTLLSCAAAARGLPLSGSGSGAIRASPGRQARNVEGVRVVQGSHPPSPAVSPAGSTKGRGRSWSPETAARKKREAARVKRLRDLAGLNVSLTVLAFSAGAVVVLSAIGFGVGYWVGREVGKVEGGTR
jgi:hypothetical protein